jgi:hypothetical protein
MGRIEKSKIGSGKPQQKVEQSWKRFPFLSSKG